MNFFNRRIENVKQTIAQRRKDVLKVTFRDGHIAMLPAVYVIHLLSGDTHNDITSIEDDGEPLTRLLHGLIETD